MIKLCNLVEIVENNQECVILKVKEKASTQLIGLGFFDGTETMFRLTKGNSHCCTVFSDGEKAYSWEWGDAGYTLVSKSMSKRGFLVQDCITEDFGIYIGNDRTKIIETLYIWSLHDAKGKEEHYKLMWWQNEADICIHRNGEYHTRIEGLHMAKSYVEDNILVDKISDVYHSVQTGCCIIDIWGKRR